VIQGGNVTSNRKEYGADMTELVCKKAEYEGNQIKVNKGDFRSDQCHQENKTCYCC